MIWFTIITTFLQFMGYCLVWGIRYNDATENLWNAKEDFKDFNNKHKWWHFTIPFYWVFLSIKIIYLKIKEIKKESKELLKDDQVGSNLPGYRNPPPPPNIFDRHRGVQRNLDTMLEERGLKGKSLGDILDDMVDKK